MNLDASRENHGRRHEIEAPRPGHAFGSLQIFSRDKDIEIPGRPWVAVNGERKAPAHCVGNPVRLQ